jgi:aminomethyltransferase
MVGREQETARLRRAAERPPQLVIMRGRRRVGKVTSSTWSPILKRMIALASVGKEHAEPGTILETEWTVEGYRHRIRTRVVPHPFLDLPRKRS